MDRATTQPTAARGASKTAIRGLGHAAAATALVASIQLLPWSPIEVSDRTATVALTAPLFLMLVAAWAEATRALRTSIGSAALLGVAGTCLCIGLLLDMGGTADTGKVLVALAAGSVAALWFERPSWIAAALIGIALSDAWSVWSADGFTRQLQGGGGDVARLLVIELPGVGTDRGLGPLGVLDIAYVAFLLAAGRRWQIPLIRIGAALVASLTAVGLVATIQHGFVPVLPFTSTAVVLALAPYLRAELRWHRAGSRGWSSTVELADSR